MSNWSVGKKIRALRKEKGLTQKELSARSGIAEITIRQYEAEKYNPKADAVMKLCVGLNCKITDLIDEEHQKYYRAFDNITDTRPNVSDQIDEYFEHQKKLNFDNAERHHLLTHYYDTLERTGRDALLEILGNLQLLNDAGQQKATEQVEMLTEIPKYRKDHDDQ